MKKSKYLRADFRYVSGIRCINKNIYLINKNKKISSNEKTISLHRTNVTQSTYIFTLTIINIKHLIHHSESREVLSRTGIFEHLAHAFINFKSHFFLNLNTNNIK